MFRLFAVIVAGLCCLFSAGAFAGGAVGVVDVSYIMSQSLAAKSIHEQREALREKFLAEISETERVLREEEKEILEERSKLSQEEYAKKRQAYETKLIAARKMAQEKKRMLEEASNVSMDALREHLYLVVEELADERGFELVISNKNVIAGEKSLDITQETLEKLNQQIKTVPLEIKDR